MNFSAIVRGWCLLILFLATFGLVAIPALYLRILRDRLGRVTLAIHRARIGVFMTDVSSRVMMATCRLMQMRTEYHLPDSVRSYKGPLLIIANHHNSLDICLLLHLMRLLGRTNIRWLLKDSLRYVPGIGRVNREAGSVFVSKHRELTALRNVRRMAIQAKEEQAAVLLFPEGRLFRRAEPGSGFEHVLTPARGAFVTLRKTLSDYPVLSLTIDWRGAHGIKSIFAVSNFYRCHLVVTGQLFLNLNGQSPESWLIDEWRRKDQALTPYKPNFTGV